MPKVRFMDSGAGSYIIIDGVEKGHISSGPECYISIVTGNRPWHECPWTERHTVARFKHNKPKTSAKAWCKTVFSILTTAQVHEMLTADQRLTPYHLALHITEGRIPA